MWVSHPSGLVGRPVAQRNWLLGEETTSFQLMLAWVPAFAGMTNGMGLEKRWDRREFDEPCVVRERRKRLAMDAPFALGAVAVQTEAGRRIARCRTLMADPA